MKLIGLLVFLIYTNSCSLLLNNMFFNHSEESKEGVNIKIQQSKNHAKQSENTNHNIIIEDNVVPSQIEKKEFENIQESDTPLEDEIIESGVVMENFIEKNEPDNTDSLLNPDEYENIVFKDVFDNEYWGEN